MFVGIDSVEVSKIEDKVSNQRFLNKYFTKYEIEYISQTVNKAQRLAGIFCAKEAFLKMLKIGIGGGINLIDIEILHEPSGAPYINKNSIILKHLAQASITKIDLSITHTNALATAVCIGI